MGTDLVLVSFGDSEERRSLFRRGSRAQREVAQQAELDVIKLAAATQQQEFMASTRKRMTEYGMRDIAEVGQLAQDLTAGDPFIAAALASIVREFTRQTARDVRDFGRGLEI